MIGEMLLHHLQRKADGMAILNSKHGKIIMTITLHHTGSFRSLKYTRILSIV